MTEHNKTCTQWSSTEIQRFWHHFQHRKIDFYGYRFTKDGLKPTIEKVEAVRDSNCQETKEAVKSFLGMVGYLSMFIDRYSSIPAPLRTLTERKVNVNGNQKKKLHSTN